ncbi:MAG TPA: thioesterase family protein [Burkholderiales bacterium]|nr:thioesterase family protein [Burkholderiales bacterium]
MSRSRFTLFHTLRVRWAEVDWQGIVFNAHYLTYFDVAITEYWRAIGYPYPQALLAIGADTFVVKATVEYHAPARYDDVLDIGVRVARIGRTSMQFQLDVYHAEEHLISGEVIYVTADPDNRRPLPVPQPLRDAILRFERLAPQA